MSFINLHVLYQSLHSIAQVMSLGYVGQTLEAIVNGIVKSVELAHDNMQEGTLYVGQGQLFDASINRSPSAYLNNPEDERKKWVVGFLWSCTSHAVPCVLLCIALVSSYNWGHYVTVCSLVDENLVGGLFIYATSPTMI